MIFPDRLSQHNGYIRHRASGTESVFNSMPNSASLLGRRGSKILFFRGKHPPFQICRISPRPLFSDFFCTIMFDRSFQPKGTKRPSKWNPKKSKSAKSLAKVGGKFRPINQARKKEVQSVRIVLPSTFWLHFRGSQALQKACKMCPNGNQN